MIVETASLCCDDPTCEAEVVGHALVRHPHDDAAIEQARRAARKDAVTGGIEAGWSVARAGAKDGDWCPAHRKAPPQ